MTKRSLYTILFFLGGILSALAVGCGYAEPKLDEAANLFVEAKQAQDEGNKEKAIQLLSASIEARPDPWALCERAKIYAEDGADDDARADIDAGLELDPEHSDLLWLQKELKKKPNRRFKGRTSVPPSANK